MENPRVIVGAVNDRLAFVRNVEPYVVIQTIYLILSRSVSAET